MAQDRRIALTGKVFLINASTTYFVANIPFPFSVNFIKPKFTMHEGYNCYPGHGGDLLGPEPYNANLDLASCQAACEGNNYCEGIVIPNDVMKNQGGDSIAFIFSVHISVHTL